MLVGRALRTRRRNTQIPHVVQWPAPADLPIPELDDELGGTTPDAGDLFAHLSNTSELLLQE
jgi:hypothetical protein